ncbi:MAG: adenylate/guanylate cyclase domain-containing protein [Verrucomicrobiales bacterium]|nr:adenylate/guanylate cyclase domain-containing protein [Verrucomicrobiales bacterium]
MRRYALIALAIGGGAVLVASLLDFAGAFNPLSTWLREWYGEKGLFPVSKPFSAMWLDLFFLAAITFGVTWCIVDVSRVSLKILVLLCSVVLVHGLSITGALHGWFFEPFSTLTSLVLAAAAGFVFAGTEKGMRKRVLEDVVGNRVSRSTFDELLDAPDPPDFSGAVSDVTVLTCRLFDHRELREKLEPSELIQMSNLFLRSVSTFLASRGAYLDESGPELVRGYFGLLRPDENHAIEACRAALELRARLRNLRQECETRWFQAPKYGMGISTGPMTVGVYGTREHRFFSGIGAETDYSRRLAHANYRYGSDILVGPLTYTRIGRELEVRPLEMFYDPEADVMTEIYQLLSTPDAFSEEERTRRDLFWEGVIRFREKEYEKALDILSHARRPGEDDGPLEFFLEKCQAGLAGENVQPDDGKPNSEDGHARLLNLM